MSEIGRRLVHGSGVLVPGAYLIGVITWEQLQMLLLVGLLLVTVLETLRLHVGLDWQIYDHLTRSYETNNVAGYGLYMISITGVALAFDPEIAIPGMLMLMIGDPISGYLGGGELRRIKRPIAVIGMFGVCIAIALPFSFATVDGMVLAVIAAAFGAGAATVADAVKLTIRTYVIDDNLTIPVVASGALWIAYRMPL